MKSASVQWILNLLVEKQICFFTTNCTPTNCTYRIVIDLEPLLPSSNIGDVVPIRYRRTYMYDYTHDPILFIVLIAINVILD